jgi:transcription initiation factor TFIIIB Brf1 subunit/transcription initiation factor TFIIB
MSEFQLIDNLHLQELNLNENLKEDFINKQNCKHLNISSENGITYCYECGEQITNDIDKKDWRDSDNTDSLYTMDPSRCQMRKSEDRSIYKDVENLGFSDKIVELANDIYSEVTKIEKKNINDPDTYKICRGNSRKALVFACIFHSYKLSGQPQSCESLIRAFNLDRKSGLKGLKHVNLNVSKKSPVRTTYITPGNLVDEIMDSFNATPEQKSEVMLIYKKVLNKSSNLNRSRPQSVSAGIIYYWILSTKKSITLKDFTEKVKLSELTINKKCKEICKILDVDFAKLTKQN